MKLNENNDDQWTSTTINQNRWKTIKSLSFIVFLGLLMNFIDLQDFITNTRKSNKKYNVHHIYIYVFVFHICYWLWVMLTIFVEIRCKSHQPLVSNPNKSNLIDIATHSMYVCGYECHKLKFVHVCPLVFELSPKCCLVHGGGGTFVECVKDTKILMVAIQGAIL